MIQKCVHFESILDHIEANFYCTEALGNSNNKNPYLDNVLYYAIQTTKSLNYIILLEF